MSQCRASQNLINIIFFQRVDTKEIALLVTCTYLLVYYHIRMVIFSMV